jgi:hypothetical protein
VNRPWLFPGNKSHHSFDFEGFCKTNNVVSLCLSPHWIGAEIGRVGNLLAGDVVFNSRFFALFLRGSTPTVS